MLVFIKKCSFPFGSPITQVLIQILWLFLYQLCFESLLIIERVTECIIGIVPEPALSCESTFTIRIIILPAEPYPKRFLSYNRFRVTRDNRHRRNTAVDSAGIHFYVHFTLCHNYLPFLS